MKSTVIQMVSVLVILLIPMMVPAEAKGTQRNFYLTQELFTGDQAPTACAKGYHMASMWEILDVTSLRYNTTLGLTLPDSGSGPPAGDDGRGWVRTGWVGANSNIPGGSNCFAYTSSLGSGTVITLPLNWTLASELINPWRAFLWDCDVPIAVWCVQN